VSVFGVSVPAGGDVSAAALMANVYYDFDTNSKWRPFLGAGAGYANVGFNNITSGGFAIADDSGGAFAYQLKVGIGYAFTSALDGTLGYRYFGTADVDLVDSTGLPFTADGLQNHAIEVGVRYRF
jgi:opacity protein-like surface antigen